MPKTTTRKRARIAGWAFEDSSRRISFKGKYYYLYGDSWTLGGAKKTARKAMELGYKTRIIREARGGLGYLIYVSPKPVKKNRW